MKSFCLWLTALWMLGGCVLPDEQEFRTEHEKACGRGFTCPNGTVCFQGFCVVQSEGQGCSPVCREYEACANPSKECVQRYTLELMPANGTLVGLGPVTVQARLVVAPGLSAVYPDHLNFTAVASDGGPVGTFSAPSTAAGVYTVKWTPPSREVTIQLTASYPAEGGPSATTGLVVTLAPNLTLLLPTLTPSAPAGGFVYTDSNAPTSWRRDQTIPVRIESDSAGLNTNSFNVVVHGFDGGQDATGLPVTVLSSCSRKYCGNVDVPLWKPGLPAFRGNFKIDVTVSDTKGLQTTATGTIPVTRWKWSFNGMAGAPSSPAIGQQGTIYFGTNDTNGKVFALAPEGTKKWENQLGAVKGNLAVGAYNVSTTLERVYVGVNKSGTGTIYALGASGATATAHQCASGTIQTAVALLSTQRTDESTPLETAVVLGDDNSLTGLRPGASGTRNCLTINPNTSGALPGASILAKGSDVYFVDSDTKVQAYTFSSSIALGTTWSAKSGYTAPAINAAALGLGFSDSGYLVGAATASAPKAGGVFALNQAGGTTLWKNPSPFAGDPVRNISIGPGNVLFYGHEAAGGALTAVNLLGTTTRTAVSNAGSIVGAPVLGAGNLLYTAISKNDVLAVGGVTAWNTDTFTPVWKLNDSVGLVESSPTLDCARDSTGAVTPASYGILYVPSINGSLYAFVVDSPGLDTTAPWPKYQHDVRNTGNPDTPLTACPPAP